jgi:hypothetical protein
MAIDPKIGKEKPHNSLYFPTHFGWNACAPAGNCHLVHDFFAGGELRSSKRII